MTEFQKQQEANIVAANEHLHRQLAFKDAQIKTLEDRWRGDIAYIGELEAEVRNFKAGLEHKSELIEFWVNSYHELNARMNGEAA